MAVHGCLPVVDAAQRNGDPHLHSNCPPNWNEHARLYDFLQEHELVKVNVDAKISRSPASTGRYVRSESAKLARSKSKRLE